tara:strand:- start:901 stop:1827 length:927 start_codon:yes stop_codon:yes gene_type:complete
MTKALEVKGLSKTYKNKGKKFEAVKGISFDIEEGEIFGFLGPNGAGKTTTINMIIGILKKDKGSIKVLGKEFEENKEEIKNMINVSSAYHNLTNVLSVRENLKVYARLYHVKNPEERINELLKQFELLELKDKHVSHLSSGEKTRVALCKALINNPKILLLDECTVGLDPDIAEKTRNYIKKYCEENKTTVLFTSHYMFEVEELCNRIAFIKKGKIIKTDTAKNLKNMIKTQIIELTIKEKKDKVKQLLKNKNLSLIKEDPTIIFEIDANEHNISKLIAEIIKNEIEIEDIHIKKPTLSDIFIKISRE